ncbi:FAD-dependent oxidoreductase [Rhodococcus sp. 14-2483-1-2]|uniref:FAD-dependent oxidoreductase n=1 Tax=Rhodococcus sp. 14-2483-1-2 TaxID=2023147 RepID=UPI001482E85D|nr:FAD-dependent oxidoreductase [Rhodococcus sp. 14-2483-1-2]
MGSGPSGCFTAQMLRKQLPQAAIAVFDRLPVPYGLLRYGVSPDHQGTKAVTRQFDKMFGSGEVDFVGNVSVGKDVSLDRMRTLFDVVVLATGLATDRAVQGVSGDRVYGAGRVMRWFNSHPDELLFEPHFGDRVAIIGNGNVAVDVLRLLSKGASAFVGSDLDPLRLGHKPSHIHVFGRSALSAAKFDSVMIRELASIDGLAVTVNVLDSLDHQDPGVRAKAEALRDLADGSALERPRVRIEFNFGWQPLNLEIAGGAQQLGLISTDGLSTARQIEVDSVVTAVGFAPQDCQPESGHTSTGSDPEGLYRVGWLERGSAGGIPHNRADAKLLSSRIVADLADETTSTGRRGLRALAPELHDKTVDFAGWKRIDEFESAQQREGRCRVKVPDIATMIEIART